MAWRIDNAVVRGEIDSRVKGTVTGRIWLEGLEQPLVLKLTGNPWRDMAGCLLTFKNRKRKRETITGLNSDQSGHAGDMTASRKVRVFDVPVKEALAMAERGEKAPESMANAVYLEWYSDRNGRVVIESADYTLTLSGKTWRMTAEEEKQQRRENAAAAKAWADRLTQALDEASEKGDKKKKKADSYDWLNDEKPMDEFRWERFLKQSDAGTDKLKEVEEKYAHLPPEERMRLIAREMGWTELGSYLDAKAKGEVPEEDEPDEDIPELDDPQPDPAKEGIDWVRDETGYPVHPLYKKSLDLYRAFYGELEKAGVLRDEANTPLQDMLFAGHMVNSKLAGALNSLWMSFPPEPGFVIAYLKRALPFYNEALAHWKKVLAEGKIDAKLLHDYRDRLFGIREEILDLMNRFRAAGDS